MAKTYDYVAIEKKWQDYWRENKTFRAPDPGDEGFDEDKPKYYVLDMFPYPSGAGLHVGHPLGYIGTDIVARHKRMTGYNVLHPMGFDSFGLPAEQYAIETGVHPRKTTERNINNMRRQLKAFGLSYDWDRELATTDEDYYRWTQWIFLQLFESYLDERDQKAHPIAELEARLESGELTVDAELRAVDPETTPVEGLGGATLRGWSMLSAQAKRQVLDHHRLAYIAQVPVNWCPALGTVLANEEVTAEGRSERGDHPVYKRPLRQWMLRITAFAERLLSELELCDWPEKIKLMQRNWIGRSEGALADFDVIGTSAQIKVFTTRPDTLFGATYMVLAPEHELVAQVTTDAQQGAVEAYQKAAAARSEIDRQADGKEKTGVFTGGYARNPVNGEQIPIWIADYVMMGYGTGAIMAVPAHDQRDFEFATQFELPLIPVVLPDGAWLREQAKAAGREVAGAEGDGEGEAALAALRDDYLHNVAAYRVAFSGTGPGINSKNDEVSLDGVETPEAKERITEWLRKKGLGRFQVQYKLRDWLFSRQRYWGEPFPIAHGEDGSLHGIADDELPVSLPPMDDFSPPKSDDPAVPPLPSLSRAPVEWREIERDGKKLVRELNTMPQWAGSCWYYLRFIDPKNADAMVDPVKEKYWMGGGEDGVGGIDLYVGGAEHAVLHLLYARFWHKVLFDLGHVSTREPFGRLFNQGYILAHAYHDQRNVSVPADEVEEKDGDWFFKGEKVKRSYGKMGKSLKNAVNPDDMFEAYGCDTMRLYEMYMGPLETSKPWNTRDVVGVHRFLQRVWRNFYGEDRGEEAAASEEQQAQFLVTDEPASDELKRALHKTIKAVSDDMDRIRFNTALARLIELNNELVKLETLPREIAEPLALMLAPLAPHVAEELWRDLGHEESIAYARWPSYDEALLVDDEIEIAVQIKGKTRGRIRVPADADKDAIQAAALADPKLAKHVEGKEIKKVIYVPGRLLNIVAI
jgi:leucyl-tRNA synthetase